MCWVALDRLLKLHEKGVVSLGQLAAQFRSERDAIAAAIERRAYNPVIESYVGEFDGDALDASLLLMPCRLQAGRRSSRHLDLSPDLAAPWARRATRTL
jgi:GH15 family glucan-1,4-alpha-glucosidase